MGLRNLILTVKVPTLKFNLESGASTINVEVGDSIQNNAILDFKTGASSIDVNFPESVGVKITAETGLSSQEFTGYSEKDGVWYSKDYEKKLKKIELKLNAGASSIKVH